MKKINLIFSLLLLVAGTWVMISCSKQTEKEQNPAKGKSDETCANAPVPASTSQDNLKNVQQQKVTFTVKPLRFGNGFEAIDAQIMGQLGDRNATPEETLSHIRKIWLSTWVPSFDQPFEASNGNHSNLPDIFKSLTRDGMSFIELLRANKIPYLTSTDEKDAAYAVAVLSTLAAMSDGDDLSSLLASRSNLLPVCKGDLLVYMALSDAVKSIPSTAALESWIGMTNASNPVYRLIALEAGNRTLPNSWRVIENKENPSDEALNKVNKDKLAFYNLYINETEPLILSKLIEAVSGIGTSDAKQFLQSIRDRQAKLGASDIVQQADQAIAQVDKLIKAQSPNP